VRSYSARSASKAPQWEPISFVLNRLVDFYLHGDLKLDRLILGRIQLAGINDAFDLSPRFHPVECGIRSSLLRSPTLDHAGLEFPGFVTMAGWVCHATKAM